MTGHLFLSISNLRDTPGDSMTATIRWNGALTPQPANPLIANISGVGRITYPWIPETREFILHSDHSIVICEENNKTSCQIFWTTQILLMELV